MASHWTLVVTILIWIVIPGKSQNPLQITANMIAQSVEATLKPEIEATMISHGYVADRDCPAGHAMTLRHQMWLYSNYRGLWEYRLTGYHYGLLENVTYGTNASDLPDYARNFGSVILVNYQNTTVFLDCPCGPSVEWKAYGKGSNVFNYFYGHYGQGLVTLKARSPAPRLYYQTYSCQVGTKLHYFNLFTRPLGRTGVPPLMFTEGVGGPADRVNEARCELNMFHDLKTRPDRFVYIAAPFEFYWQFPKDENYEPDIRRSRQRPPQDFGEDNLFWIESASQHQVLPNESFLQVQRPPSIASSDVCNHHSHPQAVSLVDRIFLESALHVIRDVDPSDSGLYACIVVDRNGLSSAYWWDGDYPPNEHFRGFTYIRVRAAKFIHFAIGTFVFISIIVAVAILAIPDNKEDFTPESVESTERAPTTEEPVAKVTPPVDDKASKTTTSTKRKGKGKRHEVVVIDQPGSSEPGPGPNGQSSLDTGKQKK